MELQTVHGCWKSATHGNAASPTRQGAVGSFRLQVVQQTAEHKMIVHAPLAQTLRYWKVPVGNNVLKTGRHQIGTHIGEVGITAIIIFRPVTGILQTACNGRDRLRLTGILHYAGSGLCRIPAQYGNQPAVGAETVRIEIREENALLRQAVQLHGHAGFSPSVVISHEEKLSMMINSTSGRFVVNNECKESGACCRESAEIPSRIGTAGSVKPEKIRSAASASMKRY